MGWNHRRGRTARETTLKMFEKLPPPAERESRELHTLAHEKLKFELEDLERVAKATWLTVSMSAKQPGDVGMRILSRLAKTDNPKHNVAAYSIRHSADVWWFALHKYLVRFLPKLTKADMRKIKWKLHAIERIRSDWGDYEYFQKQRTGRLYPLKCMSYDAYAHHVWGIRGSKRFEKQVISGIKWRDPVTSTTWGIIGSRNIGCGIKDNKIVLAIAS